MPFTSPTIGSRSLGVPPGTVALGSGDPIVLFHGILGTPAMWSEVLPLLASTHRAIALAALGHFGGRSCEQRPAKIEHVVDDAERSLDALGLDRAHLAGNSMGGWVALELSRRGRARSVCAFSPAGLWTGTSNSGGRSKLRAIVRLTRATRALLPVTAQLGAIRKFALRDNAVHGERVPSSLMIALADAVLGCSIADDLLGTTEMLTPLEATVPTHIVWSAQDRIFPLEPFATTARERIKGASHSVLDDVGHVPMLDNPALVARTILRHVAQVQSGFAHEAAGA